MPNPSELSPSAVSIPEPELRRAEVFDSATEPGQLIRCVYPDQDELLASDPLPWGPYSVPAGTSVAFYYPKKGDEALIGKPPNGPPRILSWIPSASEPDALVP